MEAPSARPSGPPVASTGLSVVDGGPVPSAADYNLRIVHPVMLYIRDRHGAAALEPIAAAGEVPITELTSGTRWVAHAQVEALFAAAFEVLRDEQVFREACVYRMAEAMGPLRYFMLALSPHMAYGRAATSGSVVSSVSRWSYTADSRTSGRYTYTSTRSESRLMCLSRIAMMCELSALTGNSRATIVDTRCIGRGDATCEYQIYWKEGSRLLPAALGLAAGAFAVLPATHAHLATGPFAAFVLPLLGAAAGGVYEYRRLRQRDLLLGTEMEAALVELAREDAEARREILAFHQRQREWSRLLEEQVNERTASMRGVVDRIQQLQEARATTLRGFSHDLRNPLTVLRLGVQRLQRTVTTTGDRDTALMLEDLGRAAAQMEGLLAELMNSVTSEVGLIRVAPQRIEVAPLPDKLRRRLRALTHGRDIRVSSFATREAPEAIEADQLVLDRVLDNLLTNAAKYTDRGSILIEVSGSPGFLTIKISDTGRGIPDDVIERIFQPGASPKGARAPDSYGVGLSVVVQLLAQMGGRLEVMSKPDVGSTFWVHVPITIPKPLSQPPANTVFDPPSTVVERSDTSGLVGKVVTIRRTVA